MRLAPNQWTTTTLTPMDGNAITEPYRPGWVRTRRDGDEWLWVRASDAELTYARMRGLPVHRCFGPQPDGEKPGTALPKRKN